MSSVKSTPSRRTLRGSVVLVTGANGGLGTEFVRQALLHGANKVYATARTPRSWDDDRVVPLRLDVTDPSSVRAAALAASDVSLVVNNAGGSGHQSLLDDDLTESRALFETNFWGPLTVTNAFVPALLRSKGAIINVLSALSWLAIADTYSATKAALWSATNTQRLALAARNIHVLGLHLAYTDTAMNAGLDVEKNDPREVVAAAYRGLESSEYEVLADNVSRAIKSELGSSLIALYPQLR